MDPGSNRMGTDSKNRTRLQHPHVGSESTVQIVVEVGRLDLRGPGEQWNHGKVTSP
jgi:hypothetical protein